MPWERIVMVVEGAQAPLLAEALEEQGALSVDLADADAGTTNERALFGEPGAEGALWPRCRVSALFAADSDTGPALARALEASGVQALQGASLDRLEDADWVAQTQRQFEPIRIGERLWIVPTWHVPPAPSAINIVLDPGAAFGTGSHPTTRLCLAWLERAIERADSLLDYGCGSGILGIAALKLGARSATGVDIDPLALETARYNARRNGVALEVVAAQDFVKTAATVTVANILANPLRMLAPLLAAHTLPLGRIALSGILASQADEVAKAYAPWASLAIEARDGDWVLLGGRRGG
ncbi:MAG: 50S ribosomal protein L11 methyltransferase [Bacillota bacterium]